MSQNYLTTEKVDITFNAWWKVFGNKLEAVPRALEKTKGQIGGPMPPDYVPPPLRKARSAVPSTALQNYGDMPSAEDFELYRRNAPAGRIRLQLDLEAAKKWPVLPANLRDKLIQVPCFVNPLVQLAEEKKIIDKYLREHRFDTNPFGRNERPGEAERDRAAIAQRQRLLKDLEWMRQNPIGSGFYGIQRSVGRDHGTAIEKARATQNIFDLTSTAGDVKALRDEMSGDMDAAPVSR